MRQHYSDSLLGTVLLVAGLLSVPATIALAVPDEGSAYPEKQADLETVIEQLQADNPGLSKDEAMELAGLASSEVSREVLTPGVGAGENREGIILHSPTHPGIPEVGTGPQPEMTPEEQALAEKVGARAEQLKGEGLSEREIDTLLKSEFEKEFSQHTWEAGERDDSRLRELYQEGRPVGEALQQHERGEFGGERPTQEQIERYRELGGHEIDRPAVERGTFEREQVTHEPVERPTAEQPTRETERPTHERSEGMPGY